MGTDLDTFDQDLYGNPQTPPKPKVSVCLITYNHAKFIQLSLESLVSQKVTFDFEIIVGDDCSTDGTSAIVREYADKYPHLIKAYIHSQNLSKFGLPGKLNYLHTFKSSRGKYIVHIEGDDYLTDHFKLQKQADFLDSNPKVSACFHNALMKFEDNSGRKDYLINNSAQKKEIFVHDLLAKQEVWFMATAAVMYRKVLIGNTYPSWFSKSKSGDIPLYVLLADAAPIAYLDEVMSVYRRHESGLSFTDNNEDLVFLTNRIQMYKNIDIHTKKRYHSNIKKIINHYFDLIFISLPLQRSQKLRLKYFLNALPYQDYSQDNLIHVLLNKLLTPTNKEKFLFR